MDVENKKQLTSWKEIADYLGVSVRTAQRYEQEMALPVSRMGGEKGRGVLAEVESLNAWKSKVEAAPPFWKSLHFLQRYSAFVSVTCAVLAVMVMRTWLQHPFRNGPPYSSRWIESTLLVLDPSGNEIWRSVFPFRPRTDLPLRPYHGDLDGDGKTETLVPHVSWEQDAQPSALYCFSESGKQLWKLQPSRVVANQRMKFSTFYVLREFKSFASPEKDGTKWIAAVFVNFDSDPSVLVVLDGKGKQRGEYWHLGHLQDIYTADTDGDGNVELLLAGTSVAHKRAVVEIFDPRNVAGAETLPANDDKRLLNFPASTSKARILFGRSRLNRLREPFNFAYWIDNPTGESGGFQVHVSENLSREHGYLIYTIQNDLQLTSIVPSQSLYRTYQEYAIAHPGYPALGESDLGELRRGYQIELSGSRVPLGE